MKESQPCRLETSPITNRQSPPSILAIQFKELNGRRFFKVDPQVACDLTQGVVEVREMVNSHVADEGAANFIVTGAAVQPAEKKVKLETRWETNDDPVEIHRCRRDDFLCAASAPNIENPGMFSGIRDARPKADATKR
jgi:hypothetical protein